MPPPIMYLDVTESYTTPESMIPVATEYLAPAAPLTGYL